MFFAVTDVWYSTQHKGYFNFSLEIKILFNMENIGGFGGSCSLYSTSVCCFFSTALINLETK